MRPNTLHIPASMMTLGQPYYRRV